MTKTARARYTLEFKQEAVRLVESGQSTAAAAHIGRGRTDLVQRSAKALTGADSKAPRASSATLTHWRQPTAHSPRRSKPRPSDCRTRSRGCANR